MSFRILISGSEGLVGSVLLCLFEARGPEVVGQDLLARNAEEGDVRDAERVRTTVVSCDAIVHLAVVSRVVWAERDPETCWSTNVGGLHNVVGAAMDGIRHRWLVFASSREVYGQPEMLPVREDAPLHPVNVFGRSKVEGERIVRAARSDGLRATIVRLSKLYGSIGGHAGRVVPEFAQAAAREDALRVEGAHPPSASRTIGFPHNDDAARGSLVLIEFLVAGESAAPPIDLLMGQSPTLGKLAELAVRLAGARSAIELAQPRSFDVSHCYGNPALARELPHWTPRTGLHEGLGRMIEGFQVELGAQEDTGGML